MPVLLQENITSHLTALAEEFKHYFLKVSDEKQSLVLNLIRCSVHVHHNELIVLQNDSTATDLFHDKTVEEF